MKKNGLLASITAAIVAILILPQFAYAHGHASFEINDKIYIFTVGSLNEPVAVDDKTGFDLRVMSTTREEREESKKTGVSNLGTSVTGLEQTLKVELIAGGKRKILDISPAFGSPGAYRAHFIPTVQTAVSYRLFGTIDNVPFDYTWECSPVGHPQADADTTEVEIYAGVTRIEAAGAFGCPVARADLGFPEQAVIMYDLVNKDAALESAVSNAEARADSSRNFGIAGIAIGIIGLLAGLGGLRNRQSAV